MSYIVILMSFQTIPSTVCTVCKKTARQDSSERFQLMIRKNTRSCKHRNYCIIDFQGVQDLVFLWIINSNHSELQN